MNPLIYNDCVDQLTLANKIFKDESFKTLALIFIILNKEHMCIFIDLLYAFKPLYYINI